MQVSLGLNVLALFRGHKTQGAQGNSGETGQVVGEVAQGQTAVCLGRPIIPFQVVDLAQVHVNFRQQGLVGRSIDQLLGLLQSGNGRIQLVLQALQLGQLLEQAKAQPVGRGRHALHGQRHPGLPLGNVADLLHPKEALQHEFGRLRLSFRQNQAQLHHAQQVGEVGVELADGVIIENGRLRQPMRQIRL